MKGDKSIVVNLVQLYKKLPYTDVRFDKGDKSILVKPIQLSRKLYFIDVTCDKGNQLLY